MMPGTKRYTEFPYLPDFVQRRLCARHRFQQLRLGKLIAWIQTVKVRSVFLAAALAAPGSALASGAKVGVPAQLPASQSSSQINIGQPITIEQALNMAEQQSYVLQGADAQVQGAAAGITTAKAYPNPAITTYLGRQFARPIRTPGTPGLLQHYSVSQPVELPAVRRTRLEVAKLAREGTQFSRDAVRLEVRSNVKHAFSEALRRREEIDHAQENLNLLMELRRRIQVQVGVGEAARLELTRAEAEIATAQNDVKSAQLLYNASLSALKAAIGVPLPETIDPRGTLGNSVSLPSLDTLKPPVLSLHPIVRQAQAGLNQAEAQLDSEKAQRLPEVMLDAEYENQPDLRFYRLGISVPIPAWDRRRGQIAEAVAAIHQADSLVKQRKVELTAALESSYGRYEVADQQVKSLEAGALRSANAALQAAQSAYRFGARGILEVLDAQRVLQRVKGDLLQAQYERQSALTDLQELGAVK